MANVNVHFSSARTDWGTPSHLFTALNLEFKFTLDPCKLGDQGGLFGRRDGLVMSWAGHRVYCNPPYGPAIPDWLKQGETADLAVFLLPARTDNGWFHDHCLKKAKEIRFLRGRLKFGGSKSGAPFPSMIVIYERGRIG